jgi:hypothetical protein
LALLAPVPATAGAPGVTVTMVLQGGDVYSVIVAFPGVEGRKEAVSAVNDLVKRASWRPQRFEVQDVATAPGVPKQTMAAFYVAAPFPKGSVPVEPFVLAFRQWKRVSVMVGHRGTLVCEAPPLIENADLTLTTTSGESAVSIQADIHNPSISRVEMPRPLTQPKSPSPGRKSAGAVRPWWFWPGLALAFAMLGWGLVYAVMALLTGGGSRRTAPRGGRSRRS